MPSSTPNSLRFTLKFKKTGHALPSTQFSLCTYMCYEHRPGIYHDHGLWTMLWLWTMHYGLWTIDFALWTMYYVLCIMYYGLCNMDYGLWIMDYGLWHMDYGLWNMDYGLWTMDYGLWTMDYGLWSMYYVMWTMYYGWTLFEQNTLNIETCHDYSSRSPFDMPTSAFGIWQGGLGGRQARLKFASIPSCFQEKHIQYWNISWLKLQKSIWHADYCIRYLTWKFGEPPGPKTNREYSP